MSTEPELLSCLLDQYPLKVEPFLTGFSIRDASAVQTRRATRQTGTGVTADFTDLVKDVRKDSTAEQVALFWCKRALPTEPEYTDREIAVYVEFYWQLYKQPQGRHSLDILSTARKNRNYDNVPNGVSDLEEKFKDLDDDIKLANARKRKATKHTESKSKKAKVKASPHTPTPALEVAPPKHVPKRRKSVDEAAAQAVLDDDSLTTAGASASAPPLRKGSRRAKGVSTKSKKARVSESDLESEDDVYPETNPVITKTRTKPKTRRTQKSKKATIGTTVIGDVTKIEENPDNTPISSTPDLVNQTSYTTTKEEPDGSATDHLVSQQADPKQSSHGSPIDTHTGYSPLPDKHSPQPSSITQDHDGSQKPSTASQDIPFITPSQPARPRRNSSFQKGKRTSPKRVEERSSKSTPEKHQLLAQEETDVRMSSEDDKPGDNAEDERDSTRPAKRRKRDVPPPRGTQLEPSNTLDRSSPLSVGDSLTSKRRRCEDKEMDVDLPQTSSTRRETAVRPPRPESLVDHSETHTSSQPSPATNPEADSRRRKKRRSVAPSIEAPVDLTSLMNDAYNQNQTLNQTIDDDESGLLGLKSDSDPVGATVSQTKVISPPRRSAFLPHIADDGSTNAGPSVPTSPNRFLSPIGSPPASMMPTNSYMSPNRQPKPPMWSASRQELCESLPAFRSYQGGVYHSKGIVKGYLLSGFGARGGKSESIAKRRQQQLTVRPATDQKSDDASVRCLYRNYEQRLPLVLLADEKYPHLPIDVSQDMAQRGIGYVVLGHYIIQHVWSELEEIIDSRTAETKAVVRYKFAFQWCESQGEPWWCPVETNVPRSFSSSKKKSKPTKVQVLSEEDLQPPRSPGMYQECDQCRKKSPHVFETGWVCTKSECPQFWKLPSGELLPRDKSLRFNPPFTELLPSGVVDLGFPTVKEPRSEGTGTSLPCTRGFHCRRCGRLSSRWKWQHWECSNPECKVVFPVKFKIRQEWELRLPVKISTDYTLAKGLKHGVVSVGQKTFDLAGYKLHCQTFDFPKGGRVHQIRFKRHNKEVEPDDVFREYQEQAADGTLPFQRWPLKMHKLKGVLLTNYFSQNCGEPYKYIGAAEHTIPFDKAPSAVVRARKYLTNSIFDTLGRKVEFNEVLSAAYMDEQSMAYHSDDEKGLGPLVAGLSLGAPALMHFRYKNKHHPQDTKRSAMVTFVLRHGDILAMDGHEMQEYYEHTVEPLGFRIAATARTINNSSS